MMAKITRSVIWEGRKSGTTWFHPRACVVPQKHGITALMTMQSISGSDVFGAVHWSVSSDFGQTWSSPRQIPGLNRHTLTGDLVEGFCDFVPEFHSRTSTTLVLGHNVYYRNDVLTKPSSDRHPVYTVLTAQGRWLARKKLAWIENSEPALYTSNCSQRITVADGSILVPLSIGFTPDAPRVVCTALCGYDGVDLRMIKIGNALELKVGRGLLEPSLTIYQNRYYMTIRAEDNRGYVTSSMDGLEWDDKQPWCWDDDSPLIMSTTQQRWISNNKGLFLVYTRKAKENVNVMRWRAPLYIARVNPLSLRLIRSSEKIVLPMIGDGINDPDHVARMGNFHTTNISSHESWVTAGETLPADEWKGNTLMARINWK